MSDTTRKTLPTTWITLALGVVATGFLVRISVIFHDCAARMPQGAGATR